MESVLLRVQKCLARDGAVKWDLRVKSAKILIYGKLPELEDKAKQVLATVSEGDELRTHLAALRRFTKCTPINLIALRQDIARSLSGAGKYCLS